MQKRVTEKYYSKCPHCGAALMPDDKKCPYCDSNLVIERTVETTDTYRMDMNRVDFESSADSDDSNGVNFGFIVWCVVCGVMTLVFFSGAGFMGFFPLAMLVFGIVYLKKSADKGAKYSETINSGRRYDAMVLDHCVYTEERGSGDDRHTVTLAKIKVLATIDGQQKVILIRVGDPQNAARYPEGSHITLAGSGDYFVIVG